MKDIKTKWEMMEWRLVHLFPFIIDTSILFVFHCEHSTVPYIICNENNFLVKKGYTIYRKERYFTAQTVPYIIYSEYFENNIWWQTITYAHARMRTNILLLPFRYVPSYVQYKIILSIFNDPRLKHERYQD